MAEQENDIRANAQQHHPEGNYSQQPAETAKKKLLIATDNLLPRWDGVARFLSEIIPRLKMHYDITVIGPNFGHYEDSSITLIRVPVHKNIVFGDFHPPRFKYWKVRRAVKQADIVFTQALGPIGGLALLLASRQRKPIVSFIHSMEKELFIKALSKNWMKPPAHFFVGKLSRWLYNKATLLIVPSQSVAEALVWEHIHTPTREVHLGVDTAKFIPPEDKAAAKVAIHFSPDDMVVGYHGRISHEKDLITLFRAFIRVQNRHPKAKLLIVGDGVQEIKNVLQTRKGVILTGMQSNPEKYLQAMDIYVLPSLTETTSLSTLEAMSTGIPVIATEVGFVKDYIKPGYNGLFFPKQQTYYLVNQLEKLLESGSLRAFLGENARKSVLQRFNWDNTAKEIGAGLEEAFSIWKRRKDWKRKLSRKQVMVKMDF